MGLINSLTPQNLADEKQKFFADHSYNPQFRYQEIFSSEILTKWGAPQQKFSLFAQQILQARPSLHVHRQSFEHDKIVQHCREILKKIGVEEDIQISFSSTKVTRCSVNKNSITFRDPPQFSSEEEFFGTINHEVQTHLLRNLNQVKQGWKIDREKSDDKLLRTEEGLAVLHGLLSQQDQTIWRPCAYYYAVSLGVHLSFAETFQQLTSLGFDADYAWNLCLRVKRGLEDTSQPGGNTKDICYLEGIVQMWRWIENSSNNPLDLYLGKIFIEELAEKKTQIKTTQVYIPTFLKDLTTYRSTIHHIGELNYFHTIEE